MRKRNKLVYGVGINDADYNTINCKIVGTWKNMLRRGYSEEFKAKNSTYKNVSVCDEWLRFSNFREWYDINYKEGLELDKDILISGNNLYSPETCVFIPGWLNSCLLITTKRTRVAPIGVRIRKGGYYTGAITINNVDVYLGAYKTPNEAHRSWQEAKANYIQDIVNRYARQDYFRVDVAASLLTRVWKL